jgi:hypothetical protein
MGESGFFSTKSNTFFPYNLNSEYLQRPKYNKYVEIPTGHAVAQWLRHCAINRKVAGSIPDGVIGIFH